MIDLDPTIEILQKSPVFRPLSSEAMDTILKNGQTLLMEEGRIISGASPEVEFLNCVVSGELEVERLLPDHTKQTKKFSAGYVFGTIDQFFGTGTFLSAKLLSPCRLFGLHRWQMWKLLQTLPEFNRHLVFLRLSFSMAVAENFNKKNEAPIESNRVFPRFPVAGLHLYAGFGQDKIYTISNISKTGVFIEGAGFLNDNDAVEFTLRRTKERVVINLKGSVIRKLDNGVGIKLDELTPSDAQIWNDLLVEAQAMRIEHVLSPQTKALPEPRPIKLTCAGTIIDGKLLALGGEGAVVHSPTPLKGTVDAVFPDSDFPEITHNTSAQVIGKKGATNYLLLFPKFSDKLQELVMTTEPILELKVEAEPSQPPENKKTILTRDVSRFGLYRLFLNELNESVICAFTKKKVRIGEEVQVNLYLNPVDIPVSRSQQVLPFEGVVSTIEGDTITVSLHPGCEHHVRKIKTLVDTLANTTASRQLRKNVHDEQNMKHRRYVQLILMTILFLAVCMMIYEFHFRHPEP